MLDYLREHPGEVVGLSIEHLRIALSALIIAIPIALVLGILAVRSRWLRSPILWLVGILYTLPSLAVLAFLIPSQGLGLRPTLILLVVYAQVFLVRNFVAGMRGVDPATLEAAAGVGMSPTQVLVRVWLPIALPVIIAGIRITLVTTIGLAVLGGWVSAGGLGELLFTGIGTNNSKKVLAGVIAIVIVAVGTDLIMRFIQSLTPMARARRQPRDTKTRGA